VVALNAAGILLGAVETTRALAILRSARRLPAGGASTGDSPSLSYRGGEESLWARRCLRTQCAVTRQASYQTISISNARRDVGTQRGLGAPRRGCVSPLAALRAGTGAAHEFRLHASANMRGGMPGTDAGDFTQLRSVRVFSCSLNHHRRQFVLVLAWKTVRLAGTGFAYCHSGRRREKNIAAGLRWTPTLLPSLPHSCFKRYALAMATCKIPSEHWQDACRAKMWTLPFSRRLFVSYLRL